MNEVTIFDRYEYNIANSGAWFLIFGKQKAYEASRYVVGDQRGFEPEKTWNMTYQSSRCLHKMQDWSWNRGLEAPYIL